MALAEAAAVEYRKIATTPLNPAFAWQSVQLEIPLAGSKSTDAFLREFDNSYILCCSPRMLRLGMA